jgi:hypothetical protein
MILIPYITWRRHAPQVTAHLRRVLKTGRPVPEDVLYPSLTGAGGPYESGLDPVFDAAGRIVLVAGSARDASSSWTATRITPAR